MLQPNGVVTFDPVMLDKVLSPYKPNCRYLVGGTVRHDPSRTPLIEAQGEFRIPESCYIADTGHFNSVEFNLCYNQIAYCAMAQALERGWIGVHCDWNLDEFLHRQLSDCMIVEFSSKFRKPLNARHFRGVFGLEKIKRARDVLLLFTSGRYEDDDGATSTGSVTFALRMERPGENASNARDVGEQISAASGLQ
jgi:hypothetical protein